MRNNFVDVFKITVADIADMLSVDGKYGVAVSGGGDSVALFLLMLEVFGPENLVVFHFNHGLREESDIEEKWVEALANSKGVKFFAKIWDKDFTGNKQQAARNARYVFFHQKCEELGLDGVCIGHTKNDVAETMIMRMGRGSGVRGLAAMDAVTKINGVNVFRPMLGILRQELRDFLKENEQGWLEDPSNESPKYLRSRVRGGISELEKIGFGVGAIADSALSVKRADDALEMITVSFIEQNVILGKENAQINKSLLLQSDEIAQRVVEKVILTLKPAPMAPRVSKRIRMIDNMRDGAKFATLGGVKFAVKGDVIKCETE